MYACAELRISLIAGNIYFVGLIASDFAAEFKTLLESDRTVKLPFFGLELHDANGYRYDQFLMITFLESLAQYDCCFQPYYHADRQVVACVRQLNCIS